MRDLRARSRFLKDYGLVALAVVVVFGLYETLGPTPPELPSVAPSLVLPRTTGGSLSLESLQGRVVVLNFWATWCGPCRAEIPEFARFAEKHPEVSLVSVSVDDVVAPDLAPAVKRLGITWPVVVADRATQRTWDVSTLPTTVVIGPDGRIWRSHVGAMTEKDLEKAIQPPSPSTES
jgi:thiol-disulfide isomerase/thioredoxin